MYLTYCMGKLILNIVIYLNSDFTNHPSVYLFGNPLVGRLVALAHLVKPRDFASTHVLFVY